MSLDLLILLYAFGTVYDKLHTRILTVNFKTMSGHKRKSMWKSSPHHLFHVNLNYVFYAL